MSAPIRFPQQRELLEAALRALSDPTFQQRVWIDRQMDPRDRWHHDFDQVVHTICDDLRFDTDPRGSVGNWTRDMTEATAVAAVAQGIDDLLRKYGKELSDADYMRAPEWRALVQAAHRALQTLGA
jgi:hypothetical protein